jgi:two-component system sensor histidine kinase MprB
VNPSASASASETTPAQSEAQAIRPDRPARRLPDTLRHALGALRVKLRASTLRGRLARITALAVFVAIALASGAAFGLTYRLVLSQVDDELRAGPGSLAQQVVARGALPPEALDQACQMLHTGAGQASAVLPLIGGSTNTVVELAGPDGQVCRTPRGRASDLTDAQRRAVAASGRARLFDARASDGARLRVLVSPIGQGWTLSAARDLTGSLQVIRHLRGTMFGLAVLGALGALVAGSLVARAGLRPIGALADAAEHIARTQDLHVRIDVPRLSTADEVTRLADAFDRMTAALSAARERQAQLVADAGHELRTPLTSLRTNLDLLLRSEQVGRPLSDQARRELMDDVRRQLEELTHLVDEVVVLAAHEPAAARAPVRLDDVVRRATERIRPRAGGHSLQAALEPWTVTDADAVALERAVVNVLDNAVKFAPDDTAVRVSLVGGRLVVDDEGPGIDPADRERVFERFWRSPEARSVPGSGLGLAIVSAVVQAHDGTCAVEEAPGGGTRVVLTLPGHDPG